MIYGKFDFIVLIFFYFCSLFGSRVGVIIYVLLYCSLFENPEHALSDTQDALSTLRLVARSLGQLRSLELGLRCEEAPATRR